MLAGRKLAHLHGRRYDTLNFPEWLTLLFAPEDGVCQGWTRARRRRGAAHWARLELEAIRVDYAIDRCLGHARLEAATLALELYRQRRSEGGDTRSQ